MIILSQPRIVAPLGRRSWYRNVNWPFVGVILFSLAFWAFIFWCAAKAVKP